MRKSVGWTPVYFHPAPDHWVFKAWILIAKSARNHQILAEALLDGPFTLSAGPMSAVVRQEAAHDEGAFGVAEPRGL
jgi:hypothetical protein